VRGRIDWKYALSLERDDPGFDPSVLSEFRDRLIAGSTEHLVDAGYPDADSLVTSQAQDMDLVGPVPTNQHRQQCAQEGFDIASVHLDWEAKVATCPQGQTSRKWSATHDTRGKAIINIRVDRTACAACASRSQCTRSETGPREVTARPKEQHQAL
jgi:transposase